MTFASLLIVRPSSLLLLKNNKQHSPMRELEKSRSTIFTFVEAAGSLEKISSTLSTPERENSLKELLLMTDRELRRQKKKEEKNMKFCEGKSHSHFLVI